MRLNREDAVAAITAISGVYAPGGSKDVFPEKIIAAVCARGKGCVVAIHAVLTVSGFNIGQHDNFELSNDSREIIRKIYR